MLLHLSISQFTLVEQLDLELKAGMTCITGETGAGKSIMLDALSLTLGNRADASMVKQGADKAEISATFLLNARAKKWLKHNDYDDQEDEILLRRVITSEGRSRAYINGQPVSATHLKALSHCLVDIQGQHAHQLLLQKNTARKLVDSYGNLQNQVQKVRTGYQEWKSIQQQIQQFEEQNADQVAQKQLLTYQVEEFKELSPQEQEVEQLEAEQKQLSNAESSILSCQRALSFCDEEMDGQVPASNLLQYALTELEQLDDKGAVIAESRELLQQALVNIQEAGHSLRSQIDGTEINPQRLQQTEQRLSDLYQMARKHQCKPEQLFEKWQELAEQLSSLSLSEQDIEELKIKAASLKTELHDTATKLSSKRQASAKKLAKAATQHLDAMAMSNAKLVFEVSQREHINEYGLDDLDIMVQTNPGMPFAPIAKAASGGELSRISLAVQVVTAQTSHIPTMVFDEVDVGIGGGTAERVGRLLKELGSHSQVICVTHQPQVAAQGDQHLQVSKLSGKKTTVTQVRELDQKQRTEEIARMLGGVEITQNTLNHAKEMLTAI